jgi:hypothetical protein
MSAGINFGKAISGLNRSILLGFALLLLLTGTTLSREAASLQEQNRSESTEIKIPKTAQDHRELAEKYSSMATAYRQEAEEHRKMKEQYQKKVARNPKDPEGLRMRKMRMHCDNIIRHAEAIAYEAERIAEYHKLRAREIEGE